MFELLLNRLFAKKETPMVTVVHKALVVTADGTAHLEYESKKQFVVPREGETVVVTFYDADIESVVQEVVHDPVRDLVTVYTETDLDLRDGHKIDMLVSYAEKDGWKLSEPVEYHGCCKGLCPCDVKGEDVPLDATAAVDHISE